MRLNLGTPDDSRGTATFSRKTLVVPRVAWASKRPSFPPRGRWYAAKEPLKHIAINSRISKQCRFSGSKVKNRHTFSGQTFGRSSYDALDNGERIE